MGFRTWKLQLRDEVASASGDPDAAFRWLNEVERDSVEIEQYASSGRFPSLDAKLAAALSRILTGDLLHQVNLLKERYAKMGLLLKGRQILWQIYKHYKISEADGALLDLRDLLAVTLHGDNLRAFMRDWESVLNAMKEIPEHKLLKPLFLSKLKEVPP